MTLVHVVSALLMQLQNADPVRSAQTAEMVTRARIEEHEHQRRRRVSDERRRFEEKFNALAKAVEL